MDAKDTDAHKFVMKILLVLLLLATPTAVFAGTITLTPEQAEAAKEAGAMNNARDAELGLEPGRDRSIHGEMGVAVGTGGYRSVYGTAIVPLGDSATLGLSYSNERYNGYGYGRDRRGF